MIWAKRRFSGSDYVPYRDKFAPLMRAQKSRCEQFVMVAVDGAAAGASDCYVGVPDELCLRLFDGFARVSEDELPGEVDDVLVDGQTGDGPTTRFKIRQR